MFLRVTVVTQFFLDNIFDPGCTTTVARTSWVPAVSIKFFVMLTVHFPSASVTAEVINSSSIDVKASSSQSLRLLVIFRPIDILHQTVSSLRSMLIHRPLCSDVSCLTRSLSLLGFSLLFLFAQS